MSDNSLTIKVSNHGDQTVMIFTIENGEPFRLLVDALVYHFKQFLYDNGVAHDFQVKEATGQEPVLTIIWPPRYGRTIEQDHVHED